MRQPDESGASPDRLRSAEILSHRLDRPMGFLGIMFLFVVLGQVLISEASWSLVFALLGWTFWAIFVAEFLLRAYVAGFQRAFWKRNWWQVVFLLVPFLRFFRTLQILRLARVVRVARVGGILSASVRGSRSAARLLSSRIGWLIALTAVVVLAASQLLYAFGSQTSYGDALYETALATVTGTGITTADPFSRILHVVLAVYSVAVFATLAGSLGAYFLRGTTSTTPPTDHGEVPSAPLQVTPAPKREDGPAERWP
ncbi:ion transporter [Cryobacterium psychrophilum]|uniref:ion transporter n=1 Tax=Cryobacterium psychrophilum TaxID=41988 RepID=UPI0010DFB994|nr:ion transporter [Cryobacterium psychrophilum]TDW31100.1 voltage-gated potassium channel [Cryobacterium psychrophilum]